jgi:serine/threonine protein kinase
MDNAATKAEFMTDHIGKSFGRYHILEQLGEGGMATVYKAFDTRLERDVAIKIIRKGAFPADHLERILKRFEREAKALARLSHPNIVKVHDYGEQDGSPYLVMEYLPSGTLKQKMGKPTPWQDAIRILLPIAEALDYAHSHNLIHRDVKPSNILLTEHGQPMLTDFGIAKVLDLEETMELTGTSAAMGTPEYMAPEQTTAKTADHRADIYALGIVLYEMVSGRKPFIADTPMAVLIKHATEPLPRPKEIVPGLPDAVERILIKALAKKPEDRYQTMAELGDAFERVIGSQAGKPVSRGKLGHASESVKTLPETPKRQTTQKDVFPKKNGALTIGRTQARSFFMIAGISVIVVALFWAVSWLIPKIVSGGSKTPSAATESSAASPAASVNFNPHPETSDYIDSIGIPMRLIPDTSPINAFYIDKYEVSNGQYKMCDVCEPPVNRQAFDDESRAEYPVVYVTWEMSKAFCEWRNARLPAKEEWNLSAYGNEDNRSLPWGDGFGCNRANYDGCIGSTTPIGSYEDGVSPYKVYDLGGNVWEWIDADFQNLTGYHLVLGGSFKSGLNDITSETGINNQSIYSGTISDAGFRCARDATP